MEPEVPATSSTDLGQEPDRQRERAEPRHPHVLQDGAPSGEGEEGQGGAEDSPQNPQQDSREAGDSETHTHEDLPEGRTDSNMDGEEEQAAEKRGQVDGDEKAEMDGNLSSDAELSPAQTPLGPLPRGRLPEEEEEASAPARTSGSPDQQGEATDSANGLAFSQDAGIPGNNSPQLTTKQDTVLSQEPIDDKNESDHGTPLTVAADLPRSDAAQQKVGGFAATLSHSAQPPVPCPGAAAAESDRVGTEPPTVDAAAGKAPDQSNCRPRRASGSSATSSTASGRSGGRKKRSGEQRERTPPGTGGRRSMSSAGSRSSGSGAGEPPPLTSKQEIERDLERMRERKEAEAEALRKRRGEEKGLLLAGQERARRGRGLALLPGTSRSRHLIAARLRHEQLLALEQEQAELDAETRRMREEIEDKYASSVKARAPDLLTSAAEFFGRKPPSRPPIPERFRRHLTLQEIQDLQMVFQMFDVRGKGYITSGDLKRAAGMLGFKANKTVFKEMIAELSVEQKRKVTFGNFLDFVIRSQDDGPDPLDDIMQGFGLLDTGGKGYLTFADLRAAADELKLSLSNKALREMVQEADSTGSGQVTLEEFVHIMLQTSKFGPAV